MITALTIKQKELLNNMIEETRRNYTEFNQQDKSIAVKTINELYRRMGYKSPIVIFAKNPFELTIKYNLLDGELLKGLSIELNREFFSKLLSELSSELDSELLRKLSSKLLSELDRELDGELRRELSSELLSELSRELSRELNSELFIKLSSKLYSELDRELDGELRRELSRELSSKLLSELDRELDGELDGELRSELDSELDSELRRELSSELDSELRSELSRELNSKLNREFFSELRSELRRELNSKLNSELRRELNSKLNSELRSELRSELDSELDRELDGELDGELRRELSSELEKLSLYSGIFWRFWTTYYRFAEAIGVKLNTEKLDLLENFAMHCPIIAPYKGICFVSELPKRVHFKNQKLHNDGGSCIEWRATNEAGKVEHFFLNGIKVPEYLAKTPTGLLDIEFFKNEKNADIKAEFIRKYGIDRMVDIGVVIDTYQNYTNEWWAKSEYKVIDMSPIFTTVKFAPHLYMKNQTTGIYHLEALTPDCKILKDAFSKARWNGRDIEQYKTLDIK